MIRFLRKCLGSSEEWEDVGDNIAREKTSQVLRDALTARKSFSGNEEQSHTNEKKLRMKSGRKEPPQGMKETRVQDRLQPLRQKHQELQRGVNFSTSRASSNGYSPAYASLPHPCHSYGRVTISDPQNARENVPNFSSLPHQQYPVTPSSSGISFSVERKRARLCEESPLIQGYHQYPHPTPVRNIDPPITTPNPARFTTPSKVRARSLAFSPPLLEHQSNNRLSSSRRTSALNTETKYTVEEMVHKDTPRFPMQKSKVNSTNRCDGEENFDSLLNDDVLSI